MTQRWEYDDVSPPLARFPWPPEEGESVLAAFGETWKGATLNPGTFYAAVPRQGGTGPALVYYLVIGVMVAGATLFWDSLGFYVGRFDGIGPAGPGLHPVVGFLLTPAILVLMLGIAAGITHVLLLLLNGASHGFGTTVRVFAYAYSPGIFGVIPVLGGLLGSIWMVVLLIIGLREAHEADGWKPAVAVLLPFVVMVGAMILLMMFFLATAAAVWGGQL